MKHIQRIALIASLLLALAVIVLLSSGETRVQAQAQSGITAPGEGASVGGVVTVRGTATTGNFQRYELSYKPVQADDEAYTLIEGGSEPVIDGVLADWDTSIVPPGEYSLRLRVVKQDGNYQDYFVRSLFVNQEAPTSTPTSTPTPPTSLTELAVATSAERTLSIARSVTALGLGSASAPATRATVHLYFATADEIFPIGEADLQQVVTELQNSGIAADGIVSSPFGRTPGGDPAAEVRFRSDQPSNLRSFVADLRDRLAANPNLRLLDVAVRYGVDNCAELERQAVEQALTEARTRAAAIAQTAGVQLGDLVAVTEQTPLDGNAGGCALLEASPPVTTLRNDAAGVEIAVALSVTFAATEQTTEGETEQAPPTETVEPLAPTPTETPVSPLPTPTP